MLLYCQIPKPESFFPHHLGDKWVYASYEPSSGFRDTTLMWVTNDSLLSNGDNYVEISGVGNIIIDSTQNVYLITSPNTIKILDFNAPIKTWWKATQSLTIEVDTVFMSDVFRIPSTIRVFNHWFGDFSNPNNRYIISKHYYAEGFGLVQLNGYEPNYRIEYIIGAIIENVHYGNLSTTIKDMNQIPNRCKLEQNYPNPVSGGSFGNPTTSISFEIPKTEFVTLRIYDLLGNEIVTLVSKTLEAGNHSVTFDARDIPSGIYLYKLWVSSKSPSDIPLGKVGSMTATRKMTVMR